MPCSGSQYVAPSPNLGEGWGEVKKAAFTLAEVLITLGIIGIVAAMTLPALVQNYQKKANVTKAKQTYAILLQAIKLSEAENGEAKYWQREFDGYTGIGATEQMLKKYILPYLKSPELCAEGNGPDVEKKCGYVVSKDGQAYFLSNGALVSFLNPKASDNLSQAEDFWLMSILIDVNGNKGPNILGTDSFYFFLTANKGLVPFGGWTNITRDEILTGTNITLNGKEEYVSCKKSANEENPDDLYRHGCTLLLMMDGWEYKDDFPYIK